MPKKVHRDPAALPAVFRPSLAQRQHLRLFLDEPQLSPEERCLRLSMSMLTWRDWRCDLAFRF